MHWRVSPRQFSCTGVRCSLINCTVSISENSVDYVTIGIYSDSISLAGRTNLLKRAAQVKSIAWPHY